MFDLAAPPEFQLPSRIGASPFGCVPVVLALNHDHLTLMFSIHEQGSEWPLIRGRVDRLKDGSLSLQANGSRPIQVARSIALRIPLDIALNAIQKCMPAKLELRAVVHRIVHGGESFVEPSLLDEEALRDLDRLSPVAPLHQPYNLEAARAALRQWPQVPQIGCFDTAFHATLPEWERRLPLPESLDDLGIRRYGSHGLSFEHVVRTLRQVSLRIEGRALLAHLGRGASLCTTTSGRSTATTAGFSPQDGLIMGGRSGSVDASVVLQLLRMGWATDKIERLLCQQSGLLGVSGVATDLQRLRASNAPSARLACDLFMHRAMREAGGLITSQGGIELLAFTGGQGVRDAKLRAQWAKQLHFLGMEIDPEANAKECANEPLRLHTSNSAIEVWVVPCDEGHSSARAAWEYLAMSGQHPPGKTEALEAEAPL